MPPKKTLTVRRGAKIAPAHPILETEADIRTGALALRRRCAFMREVHDRVGDPPLRRHETGLEGLARVVVGQQLSMASAEAIWRRTFAMVVPFDAPTLLAAPEAGLRAAGLSAGKVRTLRAVAGAVASGLDLTELAREPEATVHEALTAIHGVGPWTADVFLMFCLGRADAWAPGDLALALAAQSVLGLEARPNARDLQAIAERWRPWRAVAARLLWAHYRTMKRSAALPV